MAGEADLVLYQFNTRPRLDPSRWAFNVHCVDGVDLTSLKVRQFDGMNWEATAKAYHERARKGAPNA